MVAFNSVVLAGRLVRDPALRYTHAGRAFCELRLSIGRTWKDACGKRHEEVCPIDVVAWDRTAEVAAQFLKKGRSVLVHGSLEYCERDGSGGERHSVRANALKFLSDGKARADHVEELAEEADGRGGQERAAPDE